MRLSDRLWKRRLWLVGLAGVTTLVLLDSVQRPANQVSATAYVAAVRVYQSVGRPMIRPFCTCRYLPSCSEYSVEAVQTHGIRYGLYLTVRRVFSCNGTVPP